MCLRFLPPLQVSAGDGPLARLKLLERKIVESQPVRVVRVRPWLTIGAWYAVVILAPPEYSVVVAGKGVTRFEWIGRIGYDEPSQIPN
jgi:hypothetical protein